MRSRSIFRRHSQKLNSCHPCLDLIFNSIKNEYQSLSEKAHKILIQFSLAYLRIKTFLSMISFDTRYRSRLAINAALSLTLTSLEPNLHILMSNKQEQISHTKCVMHNKYVYCPFFSKFILVVRQINNYTFSDL